MRILITNDDGIYSPGILVLAEAAMKFGDVRIVAPDVEQSSMAQAVSSNRPVRIRPVRLRDGIDAFKVNGTPADCVGVGAHAWGNKVDVVFSGINLGLNVGNSMWHSGTLAGAKQASLIGLRGIAWSAPESGDKPDYAAILPWLDKCIASLLEKPDWRLVNVNFPRVPKDIRYTAQSVRQYDGYIVPAKDPMNRDVYWFSVRPLEPAEEGTDRWAIEHDFVSVTPLRLDLTDHAALSQGR